MVERLALVRLYCSELARSPPAVCVVLHLRRGAPQRERRHEPRRARNASREQHSVLLCKQLLRTRVGAEERDGTTQPEASESDHSDRRVLVRLENGLAEP